MKRPRLNRGKEVSMGDVDRALSEARAAVDDLIAASEAAHAVWLTPSSPGKWTPSQVAEHVAYTLEEAAKVAAGQVSSYPNMPFFVQAVFRRLVFDRVLRKGKAPRAKTFKPFNPSTGPDTPAAARERLTSAMDTFEARCKERAEAGGTTVDFPVFGRVSLEKFVAFQALHARHHKDQIPTV